LAPGRPNKAVVTAALNPEATGQAAETSNEPGKWALVTCAGWKASSTERTGQCPVTLKVFGVEAVDVTLAPGTAF